MIILFVAPRFHTNQAPLVRSLLDAGHDVRYDVLFTGATEDHSRLQPTVIEPSLLSRWLMRRHAPTNPATYLADHSFPSVAAYARRLRAMKPDVVVIREPDRPFSWRAALAARVLGFRIVIYTQGPVHASPNRTRDLGRSIFMRTLRARWYSPVPGDRTFPKTHPDMYFVPFAADLSRGVKATWFGDGTIHLLCIGKFVKRKNHLLMVDAFDELRHRFDVRLTLAGECSTAEHVDHLATVEARVAELGLQDLVTVRSNVPFRDSGDLYLDHDVFVLPSRNEPASVSILEAMAHGLPVVCSTTSGTRWYIERGASGEVFRSDDRSDLVAVLAGVLERRERMVEMGRHGRRLAETVHDPDRVRDVFLDVIAPHSGRVSSTRDGGSV